MFSFAVPHPVSLDDQKFMDDLYCRYANLMFATAWKLLSNQSEVEDVIQSCLIKLFAKVNLLRTLEPGPLGGYIRTTVRNTILNQRREKQIEENTISKLKQEKVDEEVPSLDELLITDEQIAALQTVLKNMREHDRLLLEGRYLLDYSDVELAALVNCKPASVRMKLTRARRTALKMLEPV